MPTKPTIWLTLLLAALIGVNPFAIDAYLPAMTTIAYDFGTSLQRIEHSIGSFMFGYAAGMLLAAPASDRLGRRPVTLFGLGFFCLSTLLVSVSETSAVFMLGRVMQGLSSGIALVNVGAIVRDLYDERDSARQLSLITLLLMVLPLIAPIFGSLVLTIGSWRWIFGGLLAYALVLLAIVATRLPETAPTPDPVTKTQSLPRYLAMHVQSVLAHRRATAFALAAALSAATFFMFLSDAAFVYLEYFQLTPQQFPLAFGANVVLMGCAHFLNIQLLKRYKPRQIMPAGIAVMTLNAVAFFIYTWLADELLLPTVLFIMLALASQTLIVNNAIAAYMSRFDNNAGMANAISGALIYSVGAAAALLLGEFHGGSPQSLAAGFVVAAALAVLMTRIALSETR